MNDVLGVAARPGNVFPGLTVLIHQRVANGVQRGHKVTVFAQLLQGGSAHSGHDPHIGDHVW